MNKEQIENIIKDLENRGHEVKYRTYTDNSVSFCCNEHVFAVIDYEGAKPVVGMGISIGYHTTFNQNDVDWLNSITDYWKMYKHCISFASTVENEQELEELLLHCVEYF